MKKDRRVLRTKEFIRTALVVLIEKKGFDAITVTDLTEEANINRSTFYLHYEDKFDLLRKLEDEILTEIDHIVSNISQDDLIDEFFADKPLRFLIDFFEYIASNARLFDAILGSSGDPQFYHSLRVFITESIYGQNTKLNKLLSKSNVSSDYFTSYISSAHLGVTQRWLENGLDQSPEELALLLTKMFKLGPQGILLNENLSK